MKAWICRNNDYVLGELTGMIHVIHIWYFGRQSLILWHKITYLDGTEILDMSDI
jgi:hypothetical protein